MVAVAIIQPCIACGTRVGGRNKRGDRPARPHGLCLGCCQRELKRRQRGQPSRLDGVSRDSLARKEVIESQRNLDAVAEIAARAASFLAERVKERERTWQARDQENAQRRARRANRGKRRSLFTARMKKMVLRAERAIGIAKQKPLSELYPGV